MQNNIESADRSNVTTWNLMSRLIGESLKPYFGYLAFAVICMALMAGATGVSAWLMKPVVNEIFIAQNRDMLWFIGFAVLITFVVKGSANYGQSVLMSYIGYRIVTDNQNRLYRHLIDFDLSFFDQISSGSLVSRFLVDINHLRIAVSNALTGLGKDLLSLISLVIVMFLQDWELALISFFVFPLAILPISRLGKRMRKVTANNQEEQGLLSAILSESFDGMREVKAYGMQGYEKKRVASVLERIRALNMKSARIRSLSSPIMETLGGSAVAIVIVYGGFRVIESQTDAGSFFSFITALLLAYEPMKRLANLNNSLQEGLAGAQRMFQLLDRQAKIKDCPEAKSLSEVLGHLRFNNVKFFYDTEKIVLNNISLEVNAGQRVALVGPSGAGKSTILNLIPRFYEINSGEVFIDNYDIRKVTIKSLVKNIALVSQEVMLFDDTIRSNIAYGRPDALNEEIVRAADNAAALEFIKALPEGFDTMVGERGVRLSGGQRQRIAIARAILKDAPILLLDEATSALDTESEFQVQMALDYLMENRTTLVIAHRLSTIINADLIYVVVDGKIVEKGSHADLLAVDGNYKRLYDLQFSDQAAKLKQNNNKV